MTKSYMRAQGKPKSPGLAENRLPVQFPMTKWFEWIHEEPRHPITELMVIALKYLLEYLITWSQEGNVGFNLIFSYESSTKALKTKLNHLARSVAAEAAEDKTTRIAAQLQTTG